MPQVSVYNTAKAANSAFGSICARILIWVKNLSLPTNELIVVSGVSGSGKSSLVFDTLYAEGQRRYIETFSPYARQFLDRMDKPQVDRIDGIPPAIAIDRAHQLRIVGSGSARRAALLPWTRVEVVPKRSHGEANCANRT